MRPDQPNPTSRRKAMKSKDRKRWCGGKVGVEHDFEITYPPNLTYPAYRKCFEPRSALFGAWSCGHRLVCRNCGRQEMLMDKTACPVWQETHSGESA